MSRSWNYMHTTIKLTWYKTCYTHDGNLMQLLFRTNTPLQVIDLIFFSYTAIELSLRDCDFNYYPDYLFISSHQASRGQLSAIYFSNLSESNKGPRMEMSSFLSSLICYFVQPFINRLNIKVPKFKRSEAFLFFFPYRTKVGGFRY